jgi:protein tyrosine phosphatase (PTP) superfamily phosphohydrolase (DUF442 family)
LSAAGLSLKNGTQGPRNDANILIRFSSTSDCHRDGPHMTSRNPFFLVMIPIALCAGCGRVPAPMEPSPPTPPSLTMGEAAKDLPGLPNVLRVSDKLISGGAPDGDTGFASLQALGVQTVITVDGARPDVERARKFGLRYVHLPIGYAGVPREQALRIARAVRDLPGPIYLHCHHGKHRSPAAAAAATRCLDGQCTAAMAESLLKRAGTAPRYQGLYSAMHTLEAVPDSALDKVAADFPETAPIARFVEHMVDVDTHWDHLQEIRAAGWKSPASHPDLNPSHVALLLREAYRESARLPEMKKRPAEIQQWLAEAEQHAGQLETVLRPSPGKTVDREVAERAYHKVANDCTRCHARYRDVPQ